MEYICVIDDSITIRSVVKLVIKDLGYGLIEAINGREALQKIDEVKKAGNDLALCIVDINMPVMDGVTFISEFKKTDLFTPVLVLTTESNNELIEQAKELGASGWIVKPFETDEFRNTVKTLIN